MASFNLHSLGWKAFQDLCATILSEVLGQTVQQYFDSHDGGRDGAFNGTWKTQKGEAFRGTFTTQCKFTAKRDLQLSLGDLNEELRKARRLAVNGLADTYILMTNYRLTGDTDAKLSKAFLEVPGIKHFACYGSEWICAKIVESPRLRMLVPRVYGLGDLSQILDERAYIQAKEILSSMGEDLSKFVITAAYSRSAKALIEHGFVLLLGEAACGKSTIAAALSIAAIDEWGCRTLKIRDAAEFVRHSNPQEKQLFWIDDAFGATQFDHTLASDWNRTLPHMTAAVRRGSKIIFTSRDYVYNAATTMLKTSAFPLLTESQVIIRVEQLTPQERQQILYNHIRLGRQPSRFRGLIKHYLDSIARMPEFKPEIARRLGDPLFTARLSPAKDALENFVRFPVEHLIDVVRTLDASSRAALGVIFMRGGRLPSPITLGSEEQRAIEVLGSDPARVREALSSMNESLVLNVKEEGENHWRFKHPTVRDAFASLVAGDVELLDIYLVGSPPQRLIREISCGDVGITGVKVVVPTSRYQIVLDRLEQLGGHTDLLNFLRWRCDKLFLEAYLNRHSAFVSKLRVYSYLDAVPDVGVLCRLHAVGLLPEDIRTKAVQSIAALAVDTPDAAFLNDPIRSMLTESEIAEILQRVREQLLPNLSDEIWNWRLNFNYDEHGDPEAYFDPLVDALSAYGAELDSDNSAESAISNALSEIHSTVEELQEERPAERDEDDFDDIPRASEVREDRSIFDDVDQ